MKRLIALAFAFVFVFGTTTAARADESADNKAKIEAVQAQMDAYKRQMDAMQAQLDLLRAQRAAPPPAAPRPGPAGPAGATPVMMAPGDNTTFLIKGEPVTVYGVLDLSYDVTTKGLQPFYTSSGDSPVGAVGWQGGISSQSYVGLRGSHTNGPKYGITYQLETQIDMSSTAGTVNTNSNNSSTVKGALTSRNSYIGFGNQYAGTFRIGKTDAPYKNSTARLNPFSQTIGDYSIIMGNSGGDNRVEFGTRLDHAFWWDSPNWGGFTVSLLAAPGQNRSFDNSLIASGESDCAGGNVPGSGALAPSCNDGSWGTVYSSSMAYQKKKFYGTVAYEIHKKVNRTSDIVGPLSGLDIGDEDALKYGAQWNMGRTVLNGSYERMRRYIPAAVMYQNERSRDGFWLAATQALGGKGSADSLNLGWARANPSPGDPGQHNTPGGLNPDNMANMYTILLRHAIDRHFSVYLDYAQTVNHAAAHYDLGAGGRGLTTDCHDGTQLTALDPTNVITDPVSGLTIPSLAGTGPHCYAGGNLRGLSTGIRLQF
jgi:predicted porin